MIGLREQTVRDAKNMDDARRRHEWKVPPDYNLAVDCIDRNMDRADRICLRRGVPTT